MCLFLTLSNCCDPFEDKLPLFLSDLKDIIKIGETFDFNIEIVKYQSSLQEKNFEIKEANLKVSFFKQKETPTLLIISISVPISRIR
jgi:hypothetical protein